VRAATANDQDLLAGGGALHVPAEVVAELVGADLASIALVGRMELAGLEPATCALRGGRGF